jgi:hypothetical protein
MVVVDTRAVKLTLCGTDSGTENSLTRRMSFAKAERTTASEAIPGW